MEFFHSQIFGTKFEAKNDHRPLKRDLIKNIGKKTHAMDTPKYAIRFWIFLNPWSNFGRIDFFSLHPEKRSDEN